MRAEEIEDVLTSGEFERIFETQEDFVPAEIVDHVNFLEISNSGIFRVNKTSSKTERNRDSVDITHEDGRDLGQLLLIKGKKLDDFYTLSSAEFLAYLDDVTREEFGELGHVFSTDFLVTSDIPPAEYDRDLRSTADIWGGFSHFAAPRSARLPFSSIVANSRISVPSQHHSEAFARYTYARNPFERFLRLYHCIELLFDTITVLRIKQLTDDIRGLSTILNAHATKEVDRLISISREFICDHEALAEKLTSISGYEDIAKKIFDDHSKNGNPIAPSQNPPRWASVTGSLSAGRYSEADLKNDQALMAREDYCTFISTISAYWIYRVRCSIAHSRIGEFILTDAETGFVQDFAEPLLLEFCTQIFSSQALRDLI
ncbi:hypothetical protein [Roseibium alexandrii]|uniref:Uncharacterized protein n=1 Tax=Roseibium alexandrii (strain DSM 17067 / NCIMB 14079 / DFL-11) TaxID=244592 RepID=A0A5E8H067_ROSAD|nr:hypothetical protein [Roseibium alexandrii]EEE45660.2 hypothetical protein SADFL11_2949 [Roseibium alexandrii DFL-11]